MERKIVSRREYEESVKALFGRYMETSREFDYNVFVDYVNECKPEPEILVKESAGLRLWISGDSAAICSVDEKPQYSEYSTPYLVREWNHRTGDNLEEDFFQKTS